MRRKLFYFIICFICMFTFCNSVYAEYEYCDFSSGVDHSLNYEVKQFKIDSSGILTINGWALVHNCHNWGGISGTQNYNYNNVVANGLTSDRAGYKIYFYFKKGSEVVGFNLDGSPSIVANVNTSIGSDFTKDYCYKSGGVCYSDSFVYKNTGFTISIDMNSINLTEGEWNLYIGVNHKGYGGAIEESLAVPSLVADSDDESFVIGDTSSTADVSGNHVTAYGTTATYWKLTSNNSSERYRIKSIQYTSSANQYTLCYGGRNTYSSDNIFDVCGFSWNSDFDSNGFSCTIPDKNCSYGASGTISGVFVKITGGVKIIVRNPENFVCAPSEDTIDGCTGDSAHAVCSKMTVYPFGEDNKEAYAVVKIDEKASLVSGEDSTYDDLYNSYFGGLYPRYYVIPGRTFHYKLTYTDIASWEFVKVKGSSIYSEDAVRSEAISKMAQLYREIGSSFSNRVSISSSDSSIINFNDDGNWNCTGGSSSEFANSGSTTLTCTYDLKYLYVNGEGTAKYLETQKFSPDGTELTLGRNIYIPMTYDKDSFKWTVTGNPEDLWTVNVRNSKDNVGSVTSLLNLSIVTPGGNNSCYVNIGKSNTIGDSASGGTDPSNLHITEEDKFYAYRSVTVNDPFPDGKIPKNWEDTNDQLRLKNAYNNMNRPDYRFEFSREQLDSVRADTVNYVSWNGIKANEIDSSATSQFVRSKSILFGKHCYYGIFDDSCDEKVG